MLKIHIHVDFQHEAMETTASVPSKAFNGGGMLP